MITGLCAIKGVDPEQLLQEWIQAKV